MRQQVGTIAIMVGWVLALGAGIAAQDPTQEGPTRGFGTAKPITEGKQPLDQTRLGSDLPRHLVFTDHRGERVSLERFFDGRRPVILTMNYEDCPRLCSLMLNGLVDAIDGRNFLMPGEDFRLVTLSIDPKETPDGAARQRREYLKLLDRGDVGDGWDFLVGDVRSIKQVADACGYNVFWDEGRQEWVHPAAVMVCTPEGVISRYLVGTTHQPPTVRRALVEAADGDIGNVADVIAYWCFVYDPEAGRYTLVAMRVMKFGGGLVLAALATFLLVWWRRDLARSRAAKAA